LTFLDIGQNRITGHYQVDFNQWRGLQSLILEQNVLSGSIPALHYPLLELLAIQGNKLTGHLDAVFNPTAGIQDTLINLDISGESEAGAYESEVTWCNIMIMLLLLTRMYSDNRV
jgi:hypothetical protein